MAENVRRGEGAGEPPSPTAPKGLKEHVTNLTWGSIYEIWGTKADIVFYEIRGWSIFMTRLSELGDRWCNWPPSNFQNAKRALFQRKNAPFEYKSVFFHDKNQLLLTSWALFNSGPFKANLRLIVLFYYSTFDLIF